MSRSKKVTCEAENKERAIRFFNSQYFVARMEVDRKTLKKHETAFRFYYEKNSSGKGRHGSIVVKAKNKSTAQKKAQKKIPTSSVIRKSRTEELYSKFTATVRVQ